MNGEELFIKVHRNIISNPETFNQLSIPVKARLLKNYTQFKKVNHSTRADDLVFKLSYDIMDNLSLLEEKTVLIILEACGNMTYTQNGGKAFVAVRNLVSKLN